MKKLRGFGHALSVGVAAALLAGCAVQPPIAAPGATSQSPTAATRSGLAGSRMLPEAKSTDLLYAAGQRLGYVFTYPAGRLVGSFRLRVHHQRGSANGLCSDSSGNVFVTAYSASFASILEYAHGSMKPTAELHTKYPTPVGCSSDPTSENLAVTTSFPTEGLETVAIFTAARGKPKMYYEIPTMKVYAFCAYDSSGDLFVDGERSDSRFALAELPKAGNAFTAITVKGLEPRHPGNLQWVGNYLTVAVPRDRKIYVLKISGTTGTIVGRVALNGWDTSATPQSWIQGDKVVAPARHGSKEIAVWEYPQGGKPIRVLGGFGPGYSISGVTVSVQPN